MEDITKLFGFCVSMFAIYKIVVDVILSNSTRRRDEYAFTKQYISDFNSNREHIYTLEKGFFALTGKLYSIEEIKLLLSQSQPSYLISQRKSINNFVIFNEQSLQYDWTKRYTKDIVQKHADKWFLFCYILTASLALFPIFYTKETSLLTNIPTLLYILSLMVIAISSLVQHSNFGFAKQFMKDIKYQNT